MIGATVAAFATSSPELAVAITASSSGAPLIAIGDALGANVVNIGLILGLALCIGPIRAEGEVVRRELPFAVGTPLLIGLLALDGRLDRLDAAILLLVFVFWLILLLRTVRKSRAATTAVKPPNRWGSILMMACGLVLLVLAGDFMVQGAKHVGSILGWSPFVTGATLVALGTTMPELATTLVSRARGQDEIGLGAILGSCIFNGGVIVAITIAIAPTSVDPQNLAIGLVAGPTAAALVWPGRAPRLERWRAGLLLFTYAAYLVALIFV